MDLVRTSCDNRKIHMFKKTLNDISLLCCRCDSDKHLEDAKYCQHCGELLVIGAQHTFTNGVKGKAISADKKTNQIKIAFETSDGHILILRSKYYRLTNKIINKRIENLPPDHFYCRHCNKVLPKDMTCRPGEKNYSKCKSCNSRDRLEATKSCPQKSQRVRVYNLTNCVFTGRYSGGGRMRQPDEPKKPRTKTFDLIGCDTKTLRSYIKDQFPPDSNWTLEDRGTLWEIDHIVSLTSFDLADPDEFAKAVHYSNLRPLEKSKNRREKRR
jgi:hypothetical protein